MTSSSTSTSTGINSFRPLPDNDDLQGTAGAIAINRITTSSPLAELGAGIVTWVGDDEMADWTTRYEEVLYVIAGELELDSNGATTRHSEGDVITVDKGTTLTYRAKAGTQLLFALWPKYWADENA